VTLQASAPHKKPRWLSLIVAVTTLLIVGTSLASAHAGGSTPIPTRYAGGTQVDIDPPPGPSVNDVPGQVDMTQMGRNTSANPDVQIFWNWDSISAWAGNGQTGDACALFDTADTDAFINYVVCARVQNTGTPGPVVLLPPSANHPVYLFDCSNKKNDRCTNPVPKNYTAGQVLAGPLTETPSLSQTGAGDLIAHNDPFDATFVNGPGESYPHDTSLEILVDDSLVPTGVRLANVCSYPSAGNGGNNNPFDCVVTPGVQYGTLRVTKVVTNDNGGTATFGNFSYSVDGGTAAAFPADDGTIDIQVTVGNHTVTETTIATGYTASYANSFNSNSNCNSIAVTVGAVTTCTITNNDDAPSLTLVKQVTNNSGGTAVAGDWTLTATGYNSASPAAGTYPLSESGPDGYTQTSLTCSNSTGQVTSVTLGLGENVTCTFVNDDDAATPDISTEMSWTLHDSATLTGFVAGGGASTVTFTLYKGATCDANTAVENASETVNVTAGGTASTTTGFLVTEPGTYRWIASFSGNSFNAPIDSVCGDEVTVITE